MLGPGERLTKLGVEFRKPMYDAYLDIETTGLSSLCDDITVVGIYLVNGSDSRLVQLVGKVTTRNNLLESLEDG